MAASSLACLDAHDDAWDISLKIDYDFGSMDFIQMFLKMIHLIYKDMVIHLISWIFIIINHK